MEIIKIARFNPAHPSPKDASKTVPAKMFDGNDREFTIDKSLVDFVAAHQGQTVEAEWEETQNGKWTNRKLTGVTIPTTPPPAVEKPTGNAGWRRDPAESSLILRQVALKAAVEYERYNDDQLKTVDQVLRVAETFNDWLHERLPERGQNVAKSPEQRAAKEALATGGSYADALNKQKPHVAATLPAGKSLADAAREAVANHDVFEDPNPPHPADTVGREMLRPSRGAVR